VSRPNGENRPRRPRHIAATAVIALCLLIALGAGACLLAASVGWNEIVGVPVLPDNGTWTLDADSKRARLLWSGKSHDVSICFRGQAVCVFTRAKVCPECGAPPWGEHDPGCFYQSDLTVSDYWPYYEGRTIAGSGWYHWSEWSNYCPLARTALVLSLWLLLLIPLIPALVIGLALCRPYGRRRVGLCPQCGYDLTGNVSGRCPECGAVAPAGPALKSR
jgi:hypothetical protein